MSSNRATEIAPHSPISPAIGMPGDVTFDLKGLLEDTGIDILKPLTYSPGNGENTSVDSISSHNPSNFRPSKSFYAPVSANNISDVPKRKSTLTYKAKSTPNAPIRSWCLTTPVSHPKSPRALAHLGDNSLLSASPTRLQEPPKAYFSPSVRCRATSMADNKTHATPASPHNPRPSFVSTPESSYIPNTRFDPGVTMLFNELLADTGMVWVSPRERGAVVTSAPLQNHPDISSYLETMVDIPTGHSPEYIERKIGSMITSHEKLKGRYSMLPTSPSAAGKSATRPSSSKPATVTWGELKPGFAARDSTARHQSRPVLTMDRRPNEGKNRMKDKVKRVFGGVIKRMPVSSQARLGAGSPSFPSPTSPTPVSDPEQFSCMVDIPEDSSFGDILSDSTFNRVATKVDRDLAIQQAHSGKKSPVDPETLIADYLDSSGADGSCYSSSAQGLPLGMSSNISIRQSVSEESLRKKHPAPTRSELAVLKSQLKMFSDLGMESDDELQLGPGPPLRFRNYGRFQDVDELAADGCVQRRMMVFFEYDAKTRKAQPRPAHWRPPTPNPNAEYPCIKPAPGLFPVRSDDMDVDELALDDMV